MSHYKLKDLKAISHELESVSGKYSIQREEWDKKSDSVNIIINYNYPLNLKHFRRLRWLDPDGDGLVTVEEVGRKIMLRDGIASKQLARIAYAQWNYLLNIENAKLKQAISRANPIDKWKSQNKAEYTKLRRKISALGCKGIPDFVDYNKIENKLKFWEVKAPFDQKSKQRKFFEFVSVNLKTVECKFLSFNFDSVQKKRELKAYRKSYLLKTAQNVAIFSSSLTGKKIVNLANKYFVNSYRANAQSYLLKYNPNEVHRYLDKDGKAVLSKEQCVAPEKFLNSGYEIQCLLHSYSKHAKFTLKDITQITLHLYYLGYYKWWLTPFVFEIFNKNKFLEKSSQELIVECLKFEINILSVFKREDIPYLKNVVKNTTQGTSISKNKKLIKTLDSYFFGQFVAWS